MRTITLLPLRLLVTSTLVPKGSERCAAVSLAAFIRSPDAVLEVRAYQDACPHPGAALAGAWPSSAKAAMAAVAAVRRRTIFKSVVPVVKSLHVACNWLRRGEKWRKRGILYHGMLMNVTFVITLLSIFLTSRLIDVGIKP
ncbi:hypothetical protein D3C87_1541650 [compost metagenome]